MAIPQPSQQHTPSRALSEYTVGNPDTRPDLSTAATSPTISSLASNPNQVATIGIDSQSEMVAIGILGAGVTKTIDVTIPLPNMPSGLSFGVNDSVLLTPSLSITNPITGLLLQSVLTTPQGFGGQRFYQGPKLSNNVLFEAFNVRCQVTFYAAAATSAGTVTLRVEAVLWDTPG
jgi:hypothetical protein